METVKIIMEHYVNQQRETKNKIDPKLDIRRRLNRTKHTQNVYTRTNNYINATNRIPRRPSVEYCLITDWI